MLLHREAQSQPAVMVNDAISFRLGESHSLAMAVSITFKIKVLGKQIKIEILPENLTTKLSSISAWVLRYFCFAAF